MSFAKKIIWTNASINNSRFNFYLLFLLLICVSILADDQHHFCFTPAQKQVFELSGFINHGHPAGHLFGYGRKKVKLHVKEYQS
ncbi:hypothetical protein A4H97_22640 [Niastella yeongjuensis]|uniref:Uncharacterized protein n=1 Tax=Niastella yeongjuensis TaxID=354355 RepID=A0A1V9F7U5_9BACT|nr:hypothetical protein A4H97_22640 [Niastella yeongjuensis]